jgi:hypothetical protein
MPLFAALLVDQRETCKITPPGVALDKSEGSVKGIVILGGAQAPPGLPERLRTKALEISR